MDTLSQADTEIFLWINGWVGTFGTFDKMAQLIVSDYLVPVIFSAVLLGFWFGWSDLSMRERHQRGVILSSVSVAVSSIVVTLFNTFYFRHRPFNSLDVDLLFYAPTDSSFPANPIAIVVAMATGIWVTNKLMGTAMYVIALAYGLSRVYTGVFYPMDVFAGALIGISATYFVYIILKIIEPVPTLCLRLARFLCLA